MGYIYILTSTSGKSYIGQTIRPIHIRLEEHRKGKSIGCRAIYNAIQFYGWDAFDIDWYYCPDEDLNKHEELMVEVFGTLSPGGYNLREGGGSNGKHSEETKQKISESKTGEKNHWYGKTHTEETKQKMSEAQLGEKSHWYGKMHTEEIKQKISEALLGKTASDETKQKMSEAQLGEKHPMWGKHHTDETKQKMSEAQLGKTTSDETRQKMSEAKRGEKNYRSKRVYQYDLDGNFMDSFASCGDANRHLKKNGAGVRKCAREYQETAYGFKWSYDRK